MTIEERPQMLTETILHHVLGDDGVTLGALTTRKAAERYRDGLAAHKVHNAETFKKFTGIDPRCCHG